MFQLAPFASIPLDEALLAHLIEHHERHALPRLARLWRYFRNELAEPTAEGGSTQPPSQRSGLPSRLLTHSDATRDDRVPREIVIENDIAWRVHALVDFMFPRAPRLVSRARTPELARAIDDVLDAAIRANGGINLWQDLALLGSVYGHVDLLLDATQLFNPAHADMIGGVGTDRGNRPGEAASEPSLSRDRATRAVPLLRIEAVEAPRAIPLLDPDDYRRLDAYILHFERPAHRIENEGWLARLLQGRFANRRFLRSTRATTTVTDIFSDTHHQRYENGVLVHEVRHRLGRVPVVHVQNMSQPFAWEGMSDVEPLIPLQDELNTRITDRANRVTMQSFRMWLGKGIDGFTNRPVGPGQMWTTDNENASIEAFGGDADSPSERSHVEELREALDKASGVTPAAAGHIKARVGNLTSENALRISLMGTIARIKRKRVTYGRGIAELASLILHALHVSGVLRTDPADRVVEVAWPDPLPADETRRLQDALLKSQLGVSKAILRAELGYAGSSPAAG